MKTIASYAVTFLSSFLVSYSTIFHCEKGFWQSSLLLMNSYLTDAKTLQVNIEESTPDAIDAGGDGVGQTHQPEVTTASTTSTNTTQMNYSWNTHWPTINLELMTNY